MLKNLKPANEKDLDRREIEILTLLAEGKTEIEIAEEVGVHRRTVQNHLRDIFRKINAPNRLQAIFWVTKNL
jgi:LuxR family transcriptional regulator of csgAB operon